MIVCIAEKPSVAAEIAKVIGAASRKDGYYEGNNYQVTWTFGHLCSLKEPHDYLPEWKRWALPTLPMIPSRFGIKVIEDRGVAKQFATIEKLVQAADEVVNCGDAGQEGELIQRWVLLKAGCKCSMKRLWISSLTEEAIREGFNALRQGSDFDRLYQAGSSRAIGDWLLGMNATRVYTLKYGQQGQVLSIGRVQTPTLALIVERHKEIENFKPEPYWELKTTYREVVFSVASGKFQVKENAYAELEKIKGEPFTVTDYTTKEGAESAPRLFDLTALQVECNKKFGLSADETLKTIQSLYEKKLTTYPRVDTTYLSDDIFPKIPGILKGLKDYETLTAPLLADKIRKSKKVFDNSKVTDHHAIIPTGEKPGMLSRDEMLVYDLVTRRFIANFYPDSKVATTTVEGETGGIKFKTSGKQVLEPGWRVVFPPQKSSSQEENILPVFVKGESGPHEPDLQEKETQPPKPYTEATLLRAMETAGKQVDDEEMRDLMKDNGIGRPSTRAAIIETLFKRKYITKEKKNLLPTITGIQLIDVIRDDLLKSVELTGLWEKKLRQIEKGQYEVDLFMCELKQMVADVVNGVKRELYVRKIELVEDKPVEKAKAREKVAAADKDEPSLTCPRCGKGHMLKGKTAWGCSDYAAGCKTLVPFQFLNKKLSQTQFEQLIRKGKTALIKGVEVDGAKCDGVVSFDDDFQLRFEAAQEVTLVCPKCKTGEVIKGKTAWGCANYKNGCRFVVPFQLMGKSLTQNHLALLVTKGKTGKIQGFTMPGNDAPVAGILELDEEFNVKFVLK
ncbi:MAG: DNA topoisomerase 3 [Marinilabiliaceae bacterium]|nr:DNA topoisomerase 3 [Marinilabiliaceae bacterium]